MRQAFLPIGFLLSFWFLHPSSVVLALLEEEAGQLDCLISTTGHGSPKFVLPVKNEEDEDSLILSSDATSTLSASSSSSCRMALRNVTSGALVWRRSVCSSSNRNSHVGHAMVNLGADRAVTLDSTAVVRAWNAREGALDWETRLSSLITVDSETVLRLVVVDKEEEDGAPMVQVVQVTPSSSSAMIVATVHAQTGEVMAATTEENDEQAEIQVDDRPRQEEVQSQVTCAAMGWTLAISKDQEETGASLTLQATKGESTVPVEIPLNSKQDEGSIVTGLGLVKCTKDEVSLMVTTKRETTLFVTLSKDKTNSGLVGTIEWRTEEGLASLTGGVLVDASHFVPTKQESTTDSTVILSASSRWNMHWQRLQDVVSSLVQFGTDDNLSLNSGTAMGFGFDKVAVLVSQTSHRVYGLPLALGGPASSSHDDTLFKYRYNLPVSAQWHRIVHGAPNAGKHVRGINGKAHSRDVLIVSSSETDESSHLISWLCLDGATGQVQDQGSVQISSPIVQMVPIATSSSSSSCRQGALLLFKDASSTSLSTQMIPTTAGDDNKALTSMAAASDKKNGWFAHGFQSDEVSSRLESYRLELQDRMVAEVAGVTQFPDETIVRVAYPNREEVIQSPCHVLGDQSLLLKYMNPHLVVIITTAETPDSEEEPDADAFTQALERAAGIGTSVQQQQQAKPKRKPTGVSNTAPPSDAESSASSSSGTFSATPNLFVNVVDSVSGRVLYRASHSNAAIHHPVVQPSVLFSENWIIYSFLNERTRRSEIGVLSLYEGQVDQNGLTAFTSPDQLKEFSSWNARETKPFVLAKTYSVVKPITTLGVTATRSGISGKRLIMPCVDGQVYMVDRRMLEPRRPMGQVKDSEQKEGLRQYSELIPMVSYNSLSYTQTVEGVQSIASAPTDLESQTLILAFGGPDIFYARTSPSRGFDLLPESFNRVMLTIVVVVLIGFWLTLQRIVFGKTVKKGWV